MIKIITNGWAYGYNHTKNYWFLEIDHMFEELHNLLTQFY